MSFLRKLLSLDKLSFSKFLNVLFLFDETKTLHFRVIIQLEASTVRRKLLSIHISNLKEYIFSFEHLFCLNFFSNLQIPFLPGPSL